MTVYGRMLLAGLGSLIVLLGALGFQYLGGLAPCPMCIWQRWPHLAAACLAVLGVTVLWRVLRPVACVGALTMVVSTGLGVFHAGVEQGWWAGLSGCAAPDPTGMSTEELFQRLQNTDIVRCDEIAWSFAGLSMAGWNAVISLALAAVWVWAATGSAPKSPQETRRAQASSSASQ